MTTDPVVSEFADDAEMRPILQMFANGLAEICGELRRGIAAGDTELLRRVGHQLKGSGGGYGYPALTEAGRALEDAVVVAGAVNDAVRSAAEELIALCRRIR
jgi:HPt (histidine-containing phosphotransfer) domain-containing protein